MSVRAVIVDFGGVLYIPPDLRLIRRWQRVLGLKNDELVREMSNSDHKSDLMRKVFTGEISEAEVWKQVGRRWHVPFGVVRWLQKRGFTQRQYNQAMAEFIQSLRPNYRTAILSNAGDQGRQMFCEAYHLDQLVDLLVISAEEGLAKPDERIYHLTLERLGVPAQETVFVDDLVENVDAARRIGMKTVQFYNTQQVMQEIKSYLAEK
jgi:epoxide hydrolase-like predicted phosphatase